VRHASIYRRSTIASTPLSIHALLRHFQPFTARLNLSKPQDKKVTRSKLPHWTTWDLYRPLFRSYPLPL